MKKILCIITAIICLLSFTLLCFAHSGRTDSSGGHYDRITGEYHYHHGYSAHQHPNGICPYVNNEITTGNNNGIDWDYYKEKAKEKDKEQYQQMVKDYNNRQTPNISANNSDNSFNSFIYDFRTITWPLVISFFITIALMFAIYGVYELITKRYMSDKLALIVSIIIFIIIAVFTTNGFAENHVIDYYNSYSFSSFDFFDIILILVHLAFAFFSSGFIMAILSEITPLFNEKKYKSKKVYKFVLIIAFIILFIVLFDIAQYFKLFT